MESLRCRSSCKTKDWGISKPTETVHRQRPRKDMNRQGTAGQLRHGVTYRDTFQSWNNLLLRQFAEVELLALRPHWQLKQTAPGRWATPHHTSSATNAETTVSNAIRGRSYGVHRIQEKTPCKFGLTLWFTVWLKHSSGFMFWKHCLCVNLYISYITILDSIIWLNVY